MDWNLSDDGKALLDFTHKLIAIRKAHPVLHRRSFFQGRSIHGLQISDIDWFRPDGQEMSDEEWNEGWARSLGMLLNGQIMDEWDIRGRHVQDDIMLLLLNAHHEPVPFTLPGSEADPDWKLLIDTADPNNNESPAFRPGQEYPLQGRSLALLMQPAAEVRG